jgi:hypothetical protein
MSLNLKMLYGLLIGGWGGVLAWVILDLGLRIEMGAVYQDAIVNGVIVGVCIGILVGGFAGLMEGNIHRAKRGALFGLLTGCLGGMMGLLSGEWLFQTLARQEIGRLLGWTVFGLALGLSEGLAHRSRRRLFHGSLGGLMGGLFGGMAFILIREFLDKPVAGRAWGFALLGACIGLFLGLVPILLKRAWLKVVSSGRDEGKEYIVEKQITTIGRANNCDLSLYDDTSLLPVHAEIHQQNNGFILYAKGPLTLNGQSVTRYQIQDEDRITLGQVKLRFKSREE